MISYRADRLIATYFEAAVREGARRADPTGSLVPANNSEIRQALVELAEFIEHLEARAVDVEFGGRAAQQVLEYAGGADRKLFVEKAATLEEDFPDPGSLAEHRAAQKAQKAQRHRTISYFKSVLRIAGYVVLWAVCRPAAIILIFSELMGIAEEVFGA